MVVNSISDKDALPNGCRFHCYEFVDVLGRGSFGITYLAKDQNLNKTVAIKEYLPTDFAVREDGSNSVGPKNLQSQEIFEWGLRRFKDEAKILANFSHPNIVRVLTVFDCNNTTYLAMEYEAGKGLDELLRVGDVFDEESLVAIFLPILDGLVHVHAAGFIHRDIKPSNIMIREDGSPVLIDFGSARRTSQNQTSALTSLITQGYAPFEQYDQEHNRQGPWTDIYSLGATMYRLVAGRNPVDAMTRGIAIANNTDDPYIPLTGGHYDVFSKRFLSVIDCALAFKTEDRPQTAEEWTKKIRATQDKQLSTKNQERNLGKGKRVTKNIFGENRSILVRQRRSFLWPIISLAIVASVSFLYLTGGSDKEADSLKFESEEKIRFTKKMSTGKGKDIEGKDIEGKDIEGKDIEGKDIEGKDIEGKDIKGDAQKQTREKSQQASKLVAKAQVALENKVYEGEVNGEQIKIGFISALSYYRQALSIDTNNVEAREGVVSIAMFIADELDRLLLKNQFAELELQMEHFSGVAELTPLIVLYREKMENKKNTIARAVREEADGLALDRLAAEKGAKKQREAQALSQKREETRLAEIKMNKKRRGAADVLIKQKMQLLAQAVESENVESMRQLSGGPFPLEHFFSSLFTSYQSIRLEIQSDRLNKDVSKAKFRLEIKALNNRQDLPVIPSKKWRFIEGEIVNERNEEWIIHWKPF